MRYNEQLQLLRERIYEKRSLQAKQNQLYDQLEQCEKQVRELKETMQKEQADVDRLEGTSLASIFYTLLGKKEDLLDKEKAEAYAAVVKHDSAVQQLALIEQELHRVCTKLRQFSGCEQEYEALLQEKSDALRQTHSADAERLLALEDKIIEQKRQKKEIHEAVSAGSRALSIADSILSELNSAENWGTWDLVGGGMVSDFVKHGHLDEAQNKVQLLQSELRNFKTELADVAIDAEMQVRIDGFLRFADYFFDGIFADWAVLDKINQSQANVRDTKNQIESVLSKLRSMDADLDRTLRYLESEKDALVAAANL